MIQYRKIKRYTLTPFINYYGLAVTEMCVKREFQISIGAIVIFDHKNTSTNHYDQNIFTKCWAIFLVELYDKIHGEEKGKIDWFTTETIRLQSKFGLLSLIIKLFIIYLLIF